MSRKYGLGRLARAVGAVTLLSVAATGLLAAGERARPAAPPTARPGLPSVDPTREPAIAAGMEIVSPDPGATLRGTTRVRVEWPDPLGHVLFRIDDEFAYATTAPYEMRWDTTSAADGQHVITVEGYDSSGRFAGAASIGVEVANTIAAPPEGVHLSIRFNDNDMVTRVITARGELSALAAGEALPAGFDALSGSLRAEVTTSVLDLYHEGATTLVRSRLRTGTLMRGSEQQSIPEVGQNAMLQVSHNGLTIPVATATARPRLGVAEISLGLRGTPVVPGDIWESPIGVVADLYSRRAVFVVGTHVFEGLRWFRGRECAVISSRYRIDDLPVYDRAQQALVAAAPIRSYGVELTQMGRAARGGRGGAGMRGGRGGAGMRAGTAGAAAMRGGPQAGPAGRAGAAPAAGPGAARAGATGDVDQVRLVDLEGSRRTFITRQTGRVLLTEDTILGQVEFRAAARQVAHSGGRSYGIELTGAGAGMRGGRGMAGMRGGARGGAGMRGGDMAAGMRGGARAGAQQAPGAAAARAPGAPATGTIPPKLDYGFRLTSEMVIN